jgi:hypothetical protein
MREKRDLGGKVDKLEGRECAFDCQGVSVYSVAHSRALGVGQFFAPFTYYFSNGFSSHVNTPLQRGAP